MSADLNTFIKMEGTREELLEMLKVLRKYATDMHEQYKNHRDCGYLENVCASGADEEVDLEDVTDEELEEFLETSGTELTVDASGPWGCFFHPAEIGLFEAMADAAPNASFEGSIDGFVTGADVNCCAVFKDGVLNLSNFMIPDEAWGEVYLKAMKKKLSFAKFCKLFKVDKEEMDSSEYEDFLMEASDCGFPDDLEYDEFMDLCPASQLDEDQYGAALEKISDLGIVDMETFREDIDMEEYAEKQVYRPKGSSAPAGSCEGLTFVITGKVTQFKNRDAFVAYVESQGGKVTGSVSKNTNYLVNNDSESASSKNKKAKDLGIPILTEAEFVEKFGGID